VTQNADQELATWLAGATGEDPARVAAELELGARRRAFVFDELTDAGFTGDLLAVLVMRLTGVDEREVHTMIEASDQPREFDPTCVPLRDARLAENEILFRRRNEKIARLGRQQAAPEQITLVCECSDSACTHSLVMPFSEYEWLRQNPTHFTVLPGHEAPAVEDVVERRETYVIVEKHPETREQVEAADPRAGAHDQSR
jgi:hypothetical protein